MGDKEKLISDRTARLAIIITIFGGSLFIIKGTFFAWWKTFSNSAYTKTLYSVEHILILLFTSLILLISYNVGKYIYSELKGLIYSNSVENQNEIIDRANENYRLIFKTIKASGIIAAVTMVVLILYQYIYERYSIDFKSFGILVVGIILIIGYILYKKKHTFKDETIKNISGFLVHVGFYTYIVVLLFIISLAISQLALSGNREVEITLDETKGIPMKIITKNIDELEMQIQISRGIEGDNLVTIDSKEFKTTKSLVEIFKNKGEFNEKSININKVSEEISEGNYGFSLGKTKYKREYQIDLRKYMLEGENELKVLLKSKEGEYKKYLHFVTDVFIENQHIKINEKKIKVNI
ncbi:hypothetical protein BK702_10395 [Bacillus thuringiensis serovar cameroun]|nr:hypothetical protein BK702_10395 [Bacillus thuringiensis serovar cameroun]